MSEIRVIYKEPGRLPEQIWIENTIDEFQRRVGGEVMVVTNLEHPSTAFILNSHELLGDYKRNITVNGETAFGPVILAGLRRDGLCSLPGILQLRFRLRKAADMLNHNSIGV